MGLRLVKSSISTAVLALLMFANISAYAVDQAKFDQGKKIFKTNCASCHNKNVDMTGPALVNVGDRVPSKEWFNQWVRNNVALRASGDAYANEIYSKWNKAAMNTFPGLSDEELDAMWEYFNNPDPVPAGGTAASGPDPCETEAQVKAAAKGDNTMSMLLWIGIAVLTIAAIAIARIANRLNKVATAVKDDADLAAVSEELKQDKFSFKKNILQNNSVIIPVLVVFFFFAASKALVFHQGLGRQHVQLNRDHGYKPDQPIAFSHKIHAGINKIPCEYCHSGARQNKMSMVPSLNLCLNCHKAIDKYSHCDDQIFSTAETGLTGTQEMHKIYKYLGIDAKTKAPLSQEELDAREDVYKKPIEWVRIHNLPEHVYFNHAQHVVAGKIECQECHGPVEEMDVVEQHSPLSMGWCLDCHRKTEVKFTTNDFYKDYKDIHEKLRNGEIEKVTVETIGGTDCQRCHY